MSQLGYAVGHNVDHEEDCKPSLNNANAIKSNKIHRGNTLGSLVPAAVKYSSSHPKIMRKGNTWRVP